MEPSSDAVRLVSKAKALILDFDGPICDVFAGHSAAELAEQVRVRFGVEFETDDPLALIVHALEENGPVEEIHDYIAKAEYEIIDSATETPGARALIQRLSIPIAIASNNDRCAINRWLELNDLGSQVVHVEGRQPRTMKPDPRSIAEAAKALNIGHEGCLFIGDSVADAGAAESAAMPFIALANKPAKRERLEAAGATIVVDSMMPQQFLADLPTSMRPSNSPRRNGS